ELEAAFEYSAKSGGLLAGIHSLLSGKYYCLVKRVTCEYLWSELEGMRFGYVILRCCQVRRVTSEYLRSELEGNGNGLIQERLRSSAWCLIDWIWIELHVSLYVS
ncbi:hypothetical protein Tco_1399502, partial [Tanacetum coccineum]